MPNLAALQKNVDLTADLGFIKSKFDVDKYADLSILKDAATRVR